MSSVPAYHLLEQILAKFTRRDTYEAHTNITLSNIRIITNTACVCTVNIGDRIRNIDIECLLSFDITLDAGEMYKRLCCIC